MSNEEIILQFEDILKIIPHKPPFVFIDKVKIIQPEKKATGYKAVSGNEYFFQGHFPSRPIMPGVLILEALAQTACVLFLSRPDLKNKLAYFLSIENVKFRKPVLPGDTLELSIEITHSSGRRGKIKGVASVNQTPVTESEFTFIIVD